MSLNNKLNITDFAIHAHEEERISKKSLLIGVGCRNVSLMTILMCIIPEMRRMRCLLYY